MENISNEQLTKALGKLSGPAKEFMVSVEFNDILISIGKKHLLHINQIGELTVLIIYTAVGLLPITDFKKNVISKLNVSEDTVNLIIYDVNQQVFLPLKQKLYFSSTSFPEDKKDSTQEEKVEQKEENENTPTNPTPDTFADKMTTEYGLAREKVEIADQPSPSQPPAPEDTPPRHDPYREPLP